ncbi:MAG: hypothetical protein IJ587_04625 [Synergistaceae bacterium]|nr:hypothetical protein [Synergistaceae bacterium]
MQRVRNNIHRARKHTQKARKDIRRLRVRRYREELELVPNAATLRAMKEADEIVAEWKKYWESQSND